MTVLIGIRCREGIVVGADSAATFSAGQMRTIEQPVKKITIIEERVIVAGTGEIGMNQRFCAVVKAAWDARVFVGRHTAIDVAKTLTTKAIEDFASTKAAQGTYGALVAYPVGTHLELCEFPTTNFQPELKTNDLWFASMGSGQPLADPCLAFIRQAFWPDGMPSCADGIFAVVWTLAQAIRLNPGGINAPMQVATLTMQGQQPSARLLDDAEIAEHVASVDGAIEHLRQYRRDVRGEGAADIPQAPRPA